jgi:5-methyltetrahydropteroyltriglutamate--homocysteine methyltransferase
LAAFAHYPKAKEIGLGVVNPRSDEIEPPDSIVEKVNEALQYFAPEQIYLNPDCGFGTFAERPMNPAEIAGQKLRTIAKAAEQLRASVN